MYYLKYVNVCKNVIEKTLDFLHKQIRSFLRHTNTYYGMDLGLVRIVLSFCNPSKYTYMRAVRSCLVLTPEIHAGLHQQNRFWA